MKSDRVYHCTYREHPRPIRQTPRMLTLANEADVDEMLEEKE
jgi:hypothetical protein